MIRLRRRASLRLPPACYPWTVEAFPFVAERQWSGEACYELPADDYRAFGQVTQSLYDAAVRTACEVLKSDTRLEQYGWAAQRDVMRASLERDERPVVARLDFMLSPVPGRPGLHVPRLLEINGETAGCLVEAAVTQCEWGAATGSATAGDGLGAALAAALARLPRPLHVLHHPADAYIVCQARYMASLVPGASCVATDGSAAAASAAAPPLDPLLPAGGSVYKIFRWARLWSGAFPAVGAWAARRQAGIYAPAWASLLQHKGLLVDLWEALRGTSPHVLPTTRHGPHALPDAGAGGWAYKSFHGVKSEEVLVVGPGEAAALAASHPLAMPPQPPSWGPGGIWQERVPPLLADGGVYPVLCGFVVDGAFAGALVREDDSPVTVDDVSAPIAVVPSLR